MKSFAAFLLFALLASPCMANSVRIKLFNNSTTTIRNTGFVLHNGSLLISDHGNPLNNKTFAPGTHAEIYTGQASLFCGTDGYVEFQAKVENRIYQIVVTFDNPFKGDNDYRGSANAPFVIRYLNGGSGSDAMVSFELTGGPVASPDPVVPPAPPPIDLPATGSRAITGIIKWNIDSAGQPEDADLTKAFQFSISAPARFIPTPGGSGAYGDQSGYFVNVAELKSAFVTFTDARTETRNDRVENLMSSIRTVKFVVSNLPAGIPVTITAKPASMSWQPGRNFEEKPPGVDRDARWLVFMNKTAGTDSRIDYELFGGWFEGDGRYAGGPSPHAKIEQLEHLKNYRPQSDFGASRGDARIERARNLPVTRERPSMHRANGSLAQPQTRPVIIQRGNH